LLDSAGEFLIEAFVSKYKAKTQGLLFSALSLLRSLF